MTDDARLQEKIAEAGPPAPAREELFRIAWPFHPAYFGIRVIETEEELREAIVDTTPELILENLCRHVREDGMRILILEAEPGEHRTFLRMLQSAAAPATGSQS